MTSIRKSVSSILTKQKPIDTRIEIAKIAVESYKYEKFKLEQKLKQLKEFRKGKKRFLKETINNMRKDITRFSKDVNTMFPIEVDNSRSPFENLVFFNDIQSELNKPKEDFTIKVIK